MPANYVARHHIGRLQLLVVDDDPLDRENVARLLRQAGAEVDVFEADGDAAAMEMVSSRSFDCVLLDYMLPGGPSTEVLPRLREKLQHAAFIVLTGQGDESVAVHLMKIGASDYLSKDGLTGRRLWRAINFAVAMRIAERETRLAEEKSREHAEKLRAMVAVTPTISRAQNFAELAQTAADSLKDVLGVDAAFVLLEGDQGAVHVLSTSSFVLDALRTSDSWCRVRAMSHGAGEVVRRPLGHKQEALVIGLRGRDGTDVGCIAVHAPGDALNADVAESLLREFALIIAVTRDNVALYSAATRAVQARDDVLAVVSHDLRSPLGNMRLGLGLLKDTLGNGEDRLLERVQRNVDHMTHLVDELVDMVRIEGQRLDVDLQPQRVQDIVETTLALMEPLAEAAKINCIAYPVVSSEIVLGDRHRVVQVLSNLVGNAVKFTPEGGTVEVSVEARQSDVLFRVSDTGRGIAESEIDNIFNRFWRSDPTQKRGLGLGLFIAKGIVEAHGGRIWCESAPGEGATFLFTLPRQGVSVAPSQRRDGAEQ